MKEVYMFQQLNGFHKEGHILDFLQASISIIINVSDTVFDLREEIYRKEKSPLNRLDWKLLFCWSLAFSYIYRLDVKG